MSYPVDAVELDKVHHASVSFLSDSIVSNITAEDFDLSTGKPKKNLSLNSTVDAFFLNTVKESLFERKNVNDDFIYQYPVVGEVDTLRDIEITNETVIDAVFVREGASLQNMFGYYFYTVINGEKKLLTNDPSAPTSEYYYKPTVIFPHVYAESDDPNTLQTGNSRRLKGNMPNGSFSNIHVGFFLIPTGWYEFLNGSTVDDVFILYSTIDFNTFSHNSEYQLVNDKICSVYVKSKSDQGQELLLVGFEDIIVPNVDDLDYNDCVVGLEISNVANVVDYDKYAELVVETEVLRNNIMCLDDSGEYAQFDANIYNLDITHTHEFERHLIFDSLAQRDAYYDVFIQLLGNYKSKVEKIDNVDGGEYSIVVTHIFRKHDLANSIKNSKKELYVLEIRHNRHLAPVVNTYQKMLQQMLAAGSTYQEKYKLTDFNTGDEIIHLTDMIDLPTKVSSDTFRIIGNGVMDCKKGKSHLPHGNTPAIYNVYTNYNTTTNTGLIINVKMDNHPAGYKLGTKNFVRYISFQVDANAHVVVDLGDLSLYQEVNGSLEAISYLSLFNATLQNMSISDVLPGDDTIKNLVSVFRNDPESTFRTVTINEALVFYCIRLPRVKNNPTMVFLNSDIFIPWSEGVNTTSGTYYNKRTFTVVGNFKNT